MIRKSFLCVLAIMTLISCNKASQTSSNEDTLDRIRRTGIIEACVVPEPPFIIKDAKTGALSGLDVDTLNLIAQNMNAKVHWHESGIGNFVADVQSGRCDVLSQSSLFAIIPRAMALAFTQPPRIYVGLTAIVRKNDNRFKNYKNIMNFDQPNITVAINTGAAGDLWVKENFKKAKIKRIDTDAADATRFCVEVSTGRADVAIDGVDDIGYYASQHPEVLDLFRDHPFSLTPGAWAVRQNDFKWLHFLETALQFLDTQGTLDQLEKKYHVHLLHVVKQYKLQ